MSGFVPKRVRNARKRSYTNQTGLKMSGCVSKVGRSGVIDRYISRRSQCNQKYCGPVFYHGQLWNWNNDRCVPKAPRSQSFNSGVGHINSPRFLCEQTCSVNIDPDTAVGILKEYFNGGYELSLAADYQDCIKAGADLCLHNSVGFIIIKKNSSMYVNLPVHIQNAVDVINNIGYKTPLVKGGVPVLHYISLISPKNITILKSKGYGIQLNFGHNSLFAYGANNVGDSYIGTMYIRAGCKDFDDFLAMKSPPKTETGEYQLITKSSGIKWGTYWGDTLYEDSKLFWAGVRLGGRSLPSADGPTSFDEAKNPGERKYWFNGPHWKREDLDECLGDSCTFSHWPQQNYGCYGKDNGFMTIDPKDMELPSRIVDKWKFK